MLHHNPLPKVYVGDEESRGSNTEHSQQLSLQKPEVQLEDVAMTDQAPSGGQIQCQSSDGAGDLHFVSIQLEDVAMTDPAPFGGQIQGQSSTGTMDIQIVSSRSLRSRKQQKTVDSNSHEVQEHEAKAANVEERLANAERQVHDYKSKLEDAQEKLAAFKKDSKNFKADLKGKKKDLAACRRQIKESKGTIRGLKASKGDLQKAFAASEGELTKCKDELFSLQAVAQVPDSAICDRFELVSQQIVNWIDERVAIFEKAHPELEPDHVLSIGEDESAIKFLQLYPGAGEHLARNLIHRFLQDNVFGKKVYFFGLLEETVDFLRSTEQKMTDLDPPKGM